MAASAWQKPGIISSFILVRNEISLNVRACILSILIGIEIYKSNKGIKSNNFA